MILAPTNRRIIRPYDKPSFEHTQRYGLIKGHWANTNRVGLWVFNEGSGRQVLDLSGNRNDIDFTGDVTWKVGKFGVAPRYGGTNDYGKTGVSSILNLGGGDVTVSAWINFPSGFDDWATVVLYGYIVVDDDGWYGIYIDADEKVWFRAGDGSSGNHIEGGTKLQINTWYHIVGTRRGNVESLYLNGIPDATPKVAAGNWAKTNDSFLTIATATDYAFDYGGFVDNVAIYNRALSSSEIALLYREPFAGIEKRAAPVYFFVPVEGVIKELAGTVAISSTTTGLLKATRELVGTSAISSTTSGELSKVGAAWLGIDSSHIDSLCGEHETFTLAKALDGTDLWLHAVDETHWFILDLGQTYNVQKVRGRSSSGDDPTDVNIYVSDNKENWGAAVATGINTWQDTADWVEEDTTDKKGRYVKVEIVDTENVDDHIRFGWDFPIFDVYGEVLPTYKELAGTSAIASLVTGELTKIGVQELAGTCAIESITSGVLKATRNIAGTCAISSTTSGELTKTGVKELSGTSVIESTTAGVLSATRKLAGIVTIESIVTGELIKAGIKLLTGVSAIKSTVTGILITPYAIMPPFMEKDLINPFASGAWLWLVEIAVPGQDTVRIACDTKDVHYDGDDFDKFNLQIGEQIFSSDGSIPRVTLRTFQDISRKIENIINETEGALGGAVKLIRVNEKFLTSPVEALKADYDLLASESDSEWCTFTLGIPNPLTQRFPLRDYSSSICQWTPPPLFKGPRCQYTGEDTTCTGTYEDCYTKHDGNPIHWGGELGLSPSVVKGRER